MRFNDFYSYEKNKNLIIKLCKKFRVNEPQLQANCYGCDDIVFKNNLKIYDVQVQFDKIILKRREVRNFGQKSTKEYMNTVKEYIEEDGNIWYEVIKYIASDSNF